MSPAQLRSLWDRVGKPLLRVGKGGVQVTSFCFVQSPLDALSVPQPRCIFKPDNLYLMLKIGLQQHLPCANSCPMYLKLVQALRILLFVM